MNTEEKKVLLLTCPAHFLTHAFVLLFPALVMPISRDLGIEPAEVLPISFPMYLCYGILAIPWGFLSDRLGAKWALGAGVAVSGIGLVCAGLSGSVGMLMASLALVGVGCSAFHPAGMSLVSKAIRGRGRAMGILALCGSFGIAAAPFMAGGLNFAAGWKVAIIVPGAIGILLGVACFVVPLTIASQDAQKSTPVERKRAVMLFVVMGAAIIFSGLMYRGYTLILPHFLEAKLPGLGGGMADLMGGGAWVTPDTATFAATLLASGAYLLGMVGQYIGGKVADRYDLRWSYLMCFVFALPFMVLMSHVGGAFLVGTTGMFVLFAFGMQPIENSLIAVVTPVKWRSVSFGIKFTLLFGIGALAVQLVSWVEGEHGLDAVITLLTALLAVVVALLALLIFVSRGTSVRHET